MEKIALLCPIAETVNPFVFQSALAMVSYSAVNNVAVAEVGITERELIDDSRNKMAEAFLNTPYEWAFWMDSDMILPPNTICELLRVAKEKEAKLVTGIYYQRRGKHWPVIWARDPKLEDERPTSPQSKAAMERNKYLGTPVFVGKEAKEPFKVHSAGFGCVLTHRSVFETLDAPWFRFVKEGRKSICSEDFYFFTNAKEAGFDLWAVPTLRLGHVGGNQVFYKEDCYAALEREQIELSAIKAK